MRRCALLGVFGVAAGLAGCATTGYGTVSGDTKFEDLRGVLLQTFPGQVTAGPDTAATTLAAQYRKNDKVEYEAKMGLARWCIKRGQRTLPVALWKQNDVYGDFVRDVGKLGPNPRSIHEAEVCELNGQRYLVAIGSRGDASEQVVSWHTPEDLAAAKAPVAALREQRKASQAAAAALARQQAEADSLAAKQREARRLAERQAVLEKSPRGTQLTCSGNRSEDENISRLYYSCGSHSMTFADFNRYGWKVTHQSIAPGTTSRGAPVSVVSLILEKTR